MSIQELNSATENLYGIDDLNSATNKEYYQYVINDDRHMPCVGDCPQEDHDHYFGDRHEDEAEEDEEVFEDILYDEDIDFVPYDAINDAFQEVNAQKNLFKTINKRKARNIAGLHSKDVYSDIEELYRNHLQQDNAEGESEEDPVTPGNIDGLADSIENTSLTSSNSKGVNGNTDSEFYSDGLTRNNLLERKNLELVRHTFADEKSQLLQTDKFIHQIISSLEELENYENSLGKSQVSDEHVPETKPDQPDGHSNPLENLGVQKTSPKTCPCNEKIGFPNKGEAQSRINNDADNDFVDESPVSSAREEDAVADFDDLGPDELVNIANAEALHEEVVEPNAETSQEEGVESHETTFPTGQDNLSEELADPAASEGVGIVPKLSEEVLEDPKVAHAQNDDDKFVLTEKQYSKLLKSTRQPECKGDTDNSAEPQVYTIKTKAKRKVPHELHDFELPKFEDIPKVHELPDHLVEKLWMDYKVSFTKLKSI